MSGRHERLRSAKYAPMRASTSGTVSLLSRGEDEERRRPQPAVLLDVEERPQQEGRGQRHRVELVEHEEAEHRVEQEGAGEERAGARVGA